jgi:DNA polymerase-3 subunit gamma/tau
MHQALYRKWRPKVFADVYGQDHVTSVLRREVATGKISHAYLFCGSRGTGKTSCAKILAKAVNCEVPLDGEPCGECSSCRMVDDGTATDVLELDAASNNGVENVRDIRDEVIYTPAALRRRVYIIDEVHMLSLAAFNALLKTLEEPPEHVVFILATTEPHKLPATIISRCQRFDFRRIDNASIVNRLTEIAAAESIELDAGAAALIARLAQGGMRDAISTLELCAGDGGRITEDVVRAVAGVADRGHLLKTVTAVLARDTEAIFAAVDKIYASSLDITVFWSDLIGLYRDMLVIKSTKNPRAYLDLTESEFEETAALAHRFTGEALAAQSELADEALVRMTRAGSQKRLIAELTLVRMASPRMGNDTAALAERISALEETIDRLSAGGHIPAGEALHTPQKPEPVAESAHKPDKAPKPSGDPPPWTAPLPEQGRARKSTTVEPGEAEPAKPANGETAGYPADDGGNTPVYSRKIPAEAPTGSRKSQTVERGARYMRWADVVERFRQTPGCEGEAGFLELARAYKSSGGGFIITVESPSMLDFVDNDAVKARLAEIISALEGKSVEPTDVRFTAAEVKAEPDDNFDDFNM